MGRSKWHVRIHAAGHDQLAGCIDHLAWKLQVWTDLGNLLLIRLKGRQ